MDFRPQLEPYAWLWWTAANLYNPAVGLVQKYAHLLEPRRRIIRSSWGAWNACLAFFSFLGFLHTFRCCFLLTAVGLVQSTMNGAPAG